MKNISVREIMEQHDRITLRKIAQVYDLNYQSLLKKQHMPIPGEVYDPDAINYEAVDAYINDRVSSRYELDVDFAMAVDEIDWAAINEETATRPGVAATKEFGQYEIGQVYTLRNAMEPYKVVYRNEGYICLEGVHSMKLKTMNANTFLHQTPRAWEDK